MSDVRGLPVFVIISPRFVEHTWKTKTYCLRLPRNIFIVLPGGLGEIPLFMRLGEVGRRRPHLFANPAARLCKLALSHGYTW